MILCSGWALLHSSSGACGTDQITHVDHSAEKPGRGCVYMMALFARLVLQGGWDSLSVCLSLPPFFSPSSILTWTSLHGGWNTRGCNVISTVFYWSKPVNKLAQIWGEGKQTWSACLCRAERNGRGHVFRHSTATSINNVRNQVCLCVPTLPLSATWAVTKSTDCSQHTYLLRLPRSAPQADWPESGQQMRPVCHPSHKGM